MTENLYTKTTSMAGTSISLIIGVPIAVGFWSLVMFGPIDIPIMKRYLGHPVEFVEIVMFSCAITALTFKLSKIMKEKSALRQTLIPVWDNIQVHPLETTTLLENLNTSTLQTKKTIVFRRFLNVLQFVKQRGSAEDLDDQLRNFADADSIEFEGSFGLTRFITWAIPILGFLGTVLGITGAISGVTPEMLEKSMSTVTDGLALSFDATALALALTMVCMFFSFLVEKSGDQFLENLEHSIDKNLAHRFLRVQSDQNPIVEILSRHTKDLIKSTETLVTKQVDLWANSFEKITAQAEGSGFESQNRMRNALEEALTKTLFSHQQQMEKYELNSSELGRKFTEQVGKLASSLHDSSIQQQQSLQKVVESLTRQTNSLVELQQGEKHLIQIQNLMQENLNQIHSTGDFQEAVHCLTAAVHLLTSKLQGRSNEPFFNTANQNSRSNPSGKVA